MLRPSIFSARAFPAERCTLLRLASLRVESGQDGTHKHEHGNAVRYIAGVVYLYCSYTQLGDGRVRASQTCAYAALAAIVQRIARSATTYSTQKMAVTGETALVECYSVMKKGYDQAHALLTARGVLRHSILHLDC